MVPAGSGGHAGHAWSSCGCSCRLRGVNGTWTHRFTDSGSPLSPPPESGPTRDPAGLGQVAPLEACDSCHPGASGPQQPSSNHTFIYFCITDYAFDHVAPKKLENSSRDGKADHLTCLLRNLYAGQEATARTRHGTTDWVKIGKGVRLG